MLIFDQSSTVQIRNLFDGLILKNSYFPLQIGAPMHVEQSDTYAIINSGHQTDTFNLVITRSLGSDDTRMIERVAAEFNDNALPCAWWTCDEARAAEAASILDENGFIEDETDVGMLSNLDQLPVFQYPSELQIVLVESQSDTISFGKIISSLFDPPDQYIEPIYTRIASLMDNATWPLKLFLAKINGQAVATTAVFVAKDVAHIFDISTLSALRNRGYGSALTHFALTFARDRLGARHGALQASPDGLRIYERLGFQQICTFRIYSNRRKIEERRR